MSFVNSYLSLRLTNDKILPFPNNCDIEVNIFIREFWKMYWNTLNFNVFVTPQKLR